MMNEIKLKMIDFGPLLSNPKMFLFGAAAQFGINRELGEIVVSVKMPITRDGTKRPREPLL